MGRIKCFICGVYNHNKNKIVSFHKFPCDGNRLKIWCDRLGRSTSDIQSNSFICSLHFSPEDFIYYGKPKRVRLTNTAEPTRNVEKFEENTHLTNPAHSISNVDRYEETARIPNFAQPICNVNRYEESAHLTSCAKPNYIVDQYYSQPICNDNRYEGTTHLTNWVESVYNADGCKESGNHDSETESSSPLCLSKQGYNSQIDDSPNIRNLPSMVPIKEEWNLSDISDTSRTLSVSDQSRTLTASDGSCNLTGSDNDEDFVPVLMGSHSTPDQENKSSLPDPVQNVHLPPAKRRKKTIRYFGDITYESLKNPSTTSHCWKIIQSTHENQKIEIKRLQVKSRRLKNKISSLEALTKDLKQEISNLKAQRY